ncbi:hypothetical protein [Tomitella gaofuii]|nr:hypothetical protein [Tomitella gaofuii]
MSRPLRFHCSGREGRAGPTVAIEPDLAVSIVVAFRMPWLE